MPRKEAIEKRKMKQWLSDAVSRLKLPGDFVLYRLNTACIRREDGTILTIDPSRYPDFLTIEPPMQAAPSQFSSSSEKLDVSTVSSSTASPVVETAIAPIVPSEETSEYDIETGSMDEDSDNNTPPSMQV